MTYERQAMVSLLRSPGMVFYNGGSDKCALLRTVAAQIEADGRRIEALEAKLAEKDALLRECGEALDGMLEYSMFNEAWQDKHPEYRTKAATTLAKIKDATDAD